MALAAPAILASALTEAYGQSSQLPQNVVDVLNFALLLEYLESDFYELGTNSPGLIPDQYKLPFEYIRRHEQIHVWLLKKVLGSQAIAKPGFDYSAKGLFTDTFTNFQTFTAVSQAFEDTGVRAYKGQAPNLMNAKPILENGPANSCYRGYPCSQGSLSAGPERLDTLSQCIRLTNGGGQCLYGRRQCNPERD